MDDDLEALDPPACWAQMKRLRAGVRQHGQFPDARVAPEVTGT